MKRLVLLLLGVLAVGACGVRPSAVIAGGDPPSGDVMEPVVFFLSDDQLAPMVRETKGPDELLAQLAAGPTRRERDQGLRTELPPGITVRTDGVAPTPTIVVTVDPLTLTALAVDQIVCTAVSADLRANEGVTITGQGSTLQPQYCGS